jgi:hypothetical protein
MDGSPRPQSNEVRLGTVFTFVTALRDANDPHGRYPRVSSAAADSTLGYFRFVPLGRSDEVLMFAIGFGKVWRFENRGRVDPARAKVSARERGPGGEFCSQTACG